MKLTTDFKNYLDLPIDDGHLFDTWAWEQKTLEACNINGPDTMKAKEPWTRYENIQEMILDPHIYDSSAIGQGFFDSKPSEYLVVAFYKSGRPEAQIVN
jgi:hypothetical protein